MRSILANRQGDEGRYREGADGVRGAGFGGREELTEGAEGRGWVEDPAPTMTSVRKESVEVVAGEEVVETSRSHEEAGLHPIGGGCSRRREVHELDETAPTRTMVSAPAAKGAGGFPSSVKCSKQSEQLACALPMCPRAGDGTCLE